MQKKSGNDNKIKKTINILTGKLDIKVQLNETKTAKELFGYCPLALMLIDGEMKYTFQFL